MKKIAIVNGPNLNLLGLREPHIYGKKSFPDLLEEWKEQFPDLDIHHYQSNGEGELIDILHQLFREDFEGIVFNPGAYAHTSIALGDAVAAIPIPVAEVHISNIHGREAYRRRSYISTHAAGVITGFGTDVYRLGLQYFSPG